MTTPQVQPTRVYPGLDQLVLRSLVVVGGATTVVAAQAAGARPASWLQALVVGLAVLTAVRPESTVGVVLFAGAAYTWGLAPETLSPLVLLAAAGLVLAHVSALVAAQGPARMRVDGAQVRRWAARGLLLWLASLVVWVLTVAMADLPQRRLAYGLGLTVVVVVAVLATTLIGTRSERRS
jgi:hypothetical protein